MGDERLNQISQEVTQFDTPQLHQLIDDMRDTMQAHDGAGIAAPQIGVMQRIVIFSINQNERYPNVEPIAETVLINPQIEITGNQTASMWEGCLSVPDMRGFVTRPSAIRYQGFDQYGNPIDQSVDGFHATVVQHECDHLDGILYPMRLTDLSLFGFQQQLELRDDYPS